MDESLLPREIPVGGVGTCRCDCSDMNVDSDDCSGGEGRCARWGRRWGERERKEEDRYLYMLLLAVNLMPEMGGGGAEGRWSVALALRIFSLRFPVRRYFPLKFEPFQEMHKILCTYATSTAPGFSSR